MRGGPPWGWRPPLWFPYREDLGVGTRQTRDWSKVRPIGWTPIVLLVPPYGPDLASSLGTQAAMLAAPSGSTDRITRQAHP